jgi:hypothetical protein
MQRIQVAPQNCGVIINRRESNHKKKKKINLIKLGSPKYKENRQLGRNTNKYLPGDGGSDRNV